MSFRDDQRGQAIQIAAVLILGIVFISLSTNQAVVVPQENRNQEFEHNRQIQEDLQELQAAILSVPGGGPGESVSLTLGLRYPVRTFAVNPSPAAGQLRTVGTTDDRVNVSIENATTTGGAGQFWDGDPRNYTTGGLAYDPNYNEFTKAPTTAYENTVLYNRLAEDNVTVTDQQLVAGRTLNLVTLNGSLSETRSESITTVVRPTSSATRTVSLTNTSGENVTVTIPTRLSEGQWESLLEDEYYNQSGHIVEVQTRSLPNSPFDLLVIEFEPTVTYRVQLTRVGIGRGVEIPDDPAYMSMLAGNDSTVHEGATETLVVDVADRFGNPISGVRLNTTTQFGTVASTVTTDERGQATLSYEAPADIHGTGVTDTVDLSYTVDPERTAIDTDQPGNVTFDVPVRNTDNSGTDGVYPVNWRNPASHASNTNLTDCGASTCEWTATPGTNLTLTAVTGVADVPVSFAVANRSVGTVGLHENTTTSEGSTRVNLTAAARCDQRVYATSGGSGDRLGVSLLKPLSWDCVADWDNSHSQRGVVHESVGDRVATNVTRGYRARQRGLLAYWPLDEESGTTVTDARGSYDGTFENATGDPEIASETGILGTTAYRFNDNDNDDDDYNWIELQEFPNLQGSFTITAWVRTNDESDSGQRIFADDENQDGYGFSLADGPSGTLRFYFREPSGADSLDAGAVSTDTWTHVAAVYDADANTRYIYVNGSQEGTDSPGASLGTDAGPASIGGETDDAGGDTSSRFNGNIDEVRVYDRALDSDRLSRLYETGSPDADATFTTDVKTTRSYVDPADIELDNVTSSVPSDASINITVESDPNEDGRYQVVGYENITDSEDGRTETYSSLSGSGDPSHRFRLAVIMKTPTALDSPILERAEIDVDP